MVGKQGQCDADYQTAAFWVNSEYEYASILFADVHDEKQQMTNRELFHGMKIMSAGKKYTDTMGKYPVII